MSTQETSKKVIVHSKTKKIKKHKSSSHASDIDDDPSLKKYKTFTKSQKLNIIADIRKVLSQQNATKNSSLDDLSAHLENINKKKYNQALEHILAIHFPFSLKWKENKKEWQKYLKQWRRQLRIWVRNIDKPETRGSVRVVPHEKAAEFKEKMIEILKSLPSKSFELLREKSLAALKDMMQNDENESSPQYPMNDNTFSKHFWYDYKKANPDIAELYSALPICRNVPSKKIKTKTESNEDIEEESQELSSVSVFSSDPNLKLEEDRNESLTSNIIYPDRPDLFVTENSCPTWTHPVEEKNVVRDDQNHQIDTFGLEDRGEMSDSNLNVYRKIIVEPEDNEVQKTFFRQFFQDGMDT